MFDVLVDHPKKRYFLLIAFFVGCLICSMMFDLLFGWEIFCADSFNDLITVINQHPNSFYGYFFYSLITSPVLYSPDTIYVLIQTIYFLFASLNVFDWLTVLGMLGLIVSHKHKMSKLTLALQIGYLFIRTVLLIIMIVFLYQAFAINSANMALERIHITAMIMLILDGIAFVICGSYLFNIIKLFYLPLFKNAD